MLSVQVKQLFNSFQSLGSRRLWQMALAGALIFASVGVASYLASRPAFETLYAGLDQQDISRITGALREANVSFDVSADGGTLLVETGQASRARMILAERGLPRGPTAGYELFDKLGSLGLTSFMQEVTRVRALEGELSRSIQSMQGVRAARVHIASQDDGGFRRRRQAASASVVVRLTSSAERGLAQSIRRLVAAATPGLNIDAVTVLSSDGSVLAAGESETSGAAQALTLEKTLSDGFRDNVRQTLAPIVGSGNLHVSVALQLNTDKRQTTETIYNPDSRVERSVRITKENQAAQNSNGQPPTSVERNIPTDKAKTDGKVSNEENNKKEELTNYEISSKTIQTTVGAYSIERMNVAVLINKRSLLAALGDKPEERLQARMAELTDLASVAGGLLKERGDRITVSAVEFAQGEGELTPVGEPGFAAIAARQIGAVFNALAIVAVAVIGAIIASAFLKRRRILADAPEDRMAVPGVAELPSPQDAEGKRQMEARTVELGVNSRQRAQKRLELLVDADQKEAARVFKEWLRADA